MSDTNAPEEMRKQAFERVKKRRDFWPHLLIYVLVNSFIVVIRAMTSDGGSSGRPSSWSLGASAS